MKQTWREQRQNNRCDLCKRRQKLFANICQNYPPGPLTSTDRRFSRVPSGPSPPPGQPAPSTRGPAVGRTSSAAGFRGAPLSRRGAPRRLRLANFEKLVLGCIDVSGSEKKHIFQPFLQSTRSAFFCTFGLANSENAKVFLLRSSNPGQKHAADAPLHTLNFSRNS